MPTPGRTRIAVQISQAVWREEVERLRNGSRARVAAERERARLEGAGLELRHLTACSEEGEDGTRLGGLFKVYVPIADAPPSERPFAFVFSPARRGEDVYLRLVGFGERHPPPGTRSVYERAHKRLHGRYPDQEIRAAWPDASSRGDRARTGVTGDVFSEAMVIELRSGFCDPEGELVGVVERPGWRRVTGRRRSEVVDQLVRVCEERGLWEAEAWVQRPGALPRHIIGYWHPPNLPRNSPGYD